MPSKIEITPINIPSSIKIDPINVNINSSGYPIPTEILISPIDISITSSGIPIPTNITITPVYIPTNISISPVDVSVSTNIPSYISLIGNQVPSTIQLTGNIIPPVITVNDQIPSQIYILPQPGFFIPSEITLGPGSYIPSMIQFGPAPTITVDWSPVPTVNCVVTVNCPTGSSTPAAFINQQDSSDQFLNVEVGNLGIPSVINVVSPKIPDIKIDTSDVPTIIKVEKIEGISEIKIIPPINPIPSEIKIINETKIPSSIFLDASQLPKSIPVTNLDIPKSIGLKMLDDFPSEIRLNAEGIPSTIQVVGIPPVIELKGTIPSTIQLLMPEKPEIEMVYKGAPIDVKIQLDVSKLTGEGDKVNCVSIVPCK